MKKIINNTKLWFENISKGRCILSVSTKEKKNTLFVFTDKALMSVEVFYSKEE